MKKLLPILLTTTALAAPDATPRQAWKSFYDLLQQQCPAKRLDLMAPAELLNSIEDYETTLSAPDMVLVNKYMARACRDVAAGAACNNTGFLQATIKLNRLDHFAGKLCQLPVVCTAQSKCAVP